MVRLVVDVGVVVLGVVRVVIVDGFVLVVIRAVVVDKFVLGVARAVVVVVRVVFINCPSTISK